jgi:Ni/Co efflux regulator RcnB
MMRNLILAVAALGLAAGTAMAADDAAPPKDAPPADKAPPAAWHGDNFGNGPDGVKVHRGEGQMGGGWSDGDGHWRQYGEWHGGGPGGWYPAPGGWRGRGGWAGGGNVQIIAGNYAYRRMSKGGRVLPLWRDDRFYVRDWFAFGLTEPAYGQRWVRYYNDALLIGVSDGEVYDVIPDVDWHRAYGAPYSYGPPYGYGRYPYGFGGGWHYAYVTPASMVVVTPVTKTVTVTEDYAPHPKHWSASGHRAGCSCN